MTFELCHLLPHHGHPVNTMKSDCFHPNQMHLRRPAPALRRPCLRPSIQDFLRPLLQAFCPEVGAEAKL